MNKIVLITSGQPSLNPRLVKEADALIEAGYQVTVIYQHWNNWGTELDLELLKTKKWEAVRVGGTPKVNKLSYWFSRISFKLYQKLAQQLTFKYKIAENAIGRCTKLLLAKAISLKADLYIAHNLGALPVAVIASKLNKAKCGFDAEDFHRNEVTNDVEAFDTRLKTYIEDKYLHQLNYFTVASPLIGQAYQAIYPALKPIVINNVFSVSFLQKPHFTKDIEPLKIFWFSQTIGKNRGLEDAIEAISLLNNENINLTLLGNIDEIDKTYFISLSKKLNLSENQLNFIKPISPDKIFELANTYDIGLALEQSIPLNRNICLTNKIFTYLTAGLAIIASNTAAQKHFLMENPDVGKTYDAGNIQQLKAIISDISHHRDLLNRYKNNALHLAKTTYNWELESEKFLNLITAQF